MTFFGYVGYENVTFFAPEAKSPIKTVPWAAKTSVMIVALIYLLIAVSLCGMG